MMKNLKLRNFLISVFVIVWIGVFHYESVRYFYLQPFFKRPLPKMRLLFPPAGWIMFFNVNDTDGFVEVYGVINGNVQRLDPHEIIRTRNIGYDNIHRNVLSEVADPGYQPLFCRFLRYKFPDFSSFLITEIYYPSVTKTPHVRLQRVVYQCSPK